MAGYFDFIYFAISSIVDPGSDVSDLDPSDVANFNFLKKGIEAKLSNPRFKKLFAQELERDPATHIKGVSSICPLAIKYLNYNLEFNKIVEIICNKLVSEFPSDGSKSNIFIGNWSGDYVKAEYEAPSEQSWLGTDDGDKFRRSRYYVRLGINYFDTNSRLGYSNLGYIDFTVTPFSAETVREENSYSVAGQKLLFNMSADVGNHLENNHGSTKLVDCRTAFKLEMTPKEIYKYIYDLLAEYNIKI